ncbi:MAG: hypothetical protein H6667_21645 [Ardenticatenaceae bacterium]|nr:hypothetical protein [Ardenticatenaceae bacterium]
MTSDKNQRMRQIARRPSHMPQTPVYDKIIPALLIGLGVLTAVLILAGLGIAFGIIPY